MCWGILLQRLVLEIGARADDFHEGLRMKDCKNPHEGLRDALFHPKHSLFYPRQIWARLLNFDFFNKVEENPLTKKQRLAVILDEKRNLVIAGAGTGKTSTIIGKIVYLVGARRVRPENILVIAYNNAAVDDLWSRVQNLKGRLSEDSETTARELRRNLPPGVDVAARGARKMIQAAQRSLASRLEKWRSRARKVQVKTFHSVGKKIIADCGVSSRISPFAGQEEKLRKFLGEILEECLKNKKTRDLYMRYFNRHEFPEKDEHLGFETLREYAAWIRTSHLRTFNGEMVKSYGELMIANFLFRNSVVYKYERYYSPNNSLVMDRPYRPDFYLPEIDTYIEYFGVDEEGSTAPYIDSGKYREGMEWKRKTHRRGKTDLIELFYHQNRDGKLARVLKKELVKRGVDLSPRSDEEILEELNRTGKHEKFIELLSRFLAQFKENQNRASMDLLYREAGESERTKLFLRIFEIVFKKYTKELNRQGAIDFGDMISMAADLVRKNRYISNWDYIIIDEFQDISDGRHDLVKALLEQNERAKLFCVGDDWQAIYRFAGSDHLIMRDFKKRYEGATVIKLDRTFRFNDQIAEAGERFIMKNPSQIKKKLAASVKKDDPQTFLHWTYEEPIDAALRIAGLIQEQCDTSSKSLQILFRYNRNAFSDSQTRRLESEWKGDVCKQRTIHGAKGLEADYVIVVDLNSERSGFPSKREDDPVLNLVLPPSDNFPNSEERRLLYVALTRAREQTHLIANSGYMSEFADELDRRRVYYRVSVIGNKPDCECPVCSDGLIVMRKRKSDGKPFFGCSNYPICEYTAAKCVVCGKAPIARVGEHRTVCANEDCGQSYSACNKCPDGALVLVNMEKDPFLRCHTYSRTWCRGGGKRVRCPDCESGATVISRIDGGFLIECPVCDYRLRVRSDDEQE